MPTRAGLRAFVADHMQNVVEAITIRRVDAQAFASPDPLLDAALASPSADDDPRATAAAREAVVRA